MIFSASASSAIFVFFIFCHFFIILVTRPLLLKDKIFPYHFLVYTVNFLSSLLHVLLLISSAGLLWSGLTLADQDDLCSYRWPNTCTDPDWVAFQTGASDRGTSQFCGALDTNIDHVLQQCNESLQYICEVPTNSKYKSRLFNKSMSYQTIYMYKPMSFWRELCQIYTEYEKAFVFVAPFVVWVTRITYPKSEI